MSRFDGAGHDGDRPLLTTRPLLRLPGNVRAMADQPDVVAIRLCHRPQLRLGLDQRGTVERARSHKVAHAIEKTDAGLFLVGVDGAIRELEHDESDAVAELLPSHRRVNGLWVKVRRGDDGVKAEPAPPPNRVDQAARWNRSPPPTPPRGPSGKKSAESSVLGPKRREEQDLADRCLVGKQHHQPVHPETEPTCGWQPVLQRQQIVLVERVGLRLAGGARLRLRLEPGSLFDAGR